MNVFPAWAGVIRCGPGLVARTFVFPAWAGVIRTFGLLVAGALRVPRVGGGDPVN